MGTFIRDGASVLPPEKTDYRRMSVPVACNEWSAEDINKIREALLDLRTWARDISIFGMEIENPPGHQGITASDSLDHARMVVNQGYDLFTDVDGTTLQSHTPDSGATWSLKSAYNAKIYNNRVYADITGVPVTGRAIYCKADTLTADYDVEAKLYFVVPYDPFDEYAVGITARFDTNPAYLYPAAYLVAYLTADQMWALYRLDPDNSIHGLGSWNEAYPGAGTTRVVRLAVTAGQQDVYVNGTLRITAYDATYSGGVGGVYLYRNAADPGTPYLSGIHIDGYVVVGAGGESPFL